MGWLRCLRTYEKYVFKCLPLPMAPKPLDGIGTTTNAIILIAYAVGNAAGPFMWKLEYQPRFVSCCPHRVCIV